MKNKIENLISISVDRNLAESNLTLMAKGLALWLNSLNPETNITIDFIVNSFKNDFRRVTIEYFIKELMDFGYLVKVGDENE